MVARASSPGVGFGVAVGTAVGGGVTVGVAVGGNGVEVGVGVGVGDGMGVEVAGFGTMAMYTGRFPTDIVLTTEPMLPGRPLVSITDMEFEPELET